LELKFQEKSEERSSLRRLTSQLEHEENEKTQVPISSKQLQINIS